MPLPALRVAVQTIHPECPFSYQLIKADLSFLSYFVLNTLKEILL